MRAALALVVISLTALPARADSPRDPADALVDYYGTLRGYRKVRADVLRWHKTTSNACVAFVSTALRHVGVDIPQDGVRDGWGISRITFAFSDYLEKDRGWSRIDDAAKLRRGDLVFTTGYPDHVFVFVRWKSKRRRIARAIDNQGFTHARALFPDAGGEVAAFAYALRPCRPANCR